MGACLCRSEGPLPGDAATKGAANPAAAAADAGSPGISQAALALHNHDVSSHEPMNPRGLRVKIGGGAAAAAAAAAVGIHHGGDGDDGSDFDSARSSDFGSARSLFSMFSGRSLHSFTFRLNSSALYGMGGARRGCVSHEKGLLGRM